MKKMRQKKNVNLLTAIALVLLLSACGGAKPTSGNTQGTSETKQESNVPEQPSEPIAADTQQGDDGKADTKADPGYAFAYKGVDITIDAEAAPIFEVIGDALTAPFEAPDCALGGVGRIYSYNDFEIETYQPENDVERISQIVLKSDIVETAEGLMIGMTDAKVKEVYGDVAEENGMLAYAKGEMKLCFIIQDGKIVSIEYKFAELA